MIIRYKESFKHRLNRPSRSVANDDPGNTGIASPSHAGLPFAQQHPPRLSTMRTPGGYFFSGWQHLKYLKPPLSIEKQIELLQQRGMDIPDYAEAAHYLAHLSIVRNLCAHHARLWNREFTFTYKLPTTRPQAVIGSLNRKAPRRLYNTLAMLAYLMDVSCIHHHWKQRLLNLLKQHSINAKAIGAPAGFELLCLWQEL